MIDGTGAPGRGPVEIVIRRNMIQQVMSADPISRTNNGVATIRAFGVGNKNIDEQVAERQAIAENKIVAPR